jgi:hypothetical protein
MYKLINNIMSFFVLKNDLYEELHVNEMIDVLKICQPECGYYKKNICIAIGIFLKKYYKLNLIFVSSQGSDSYFDSRSSIIEGFIPSLSLNDVVLFLIEKNIIEEYKDSDKINKYKLISNERN